MKQELIKILIVINTVVFIISLGIIYYRYSMLTFKQQEIKETIQVQNITPPSVETKVEPQTEVSKEQVLTEEKQIVKETSDFIKLRRPKFVYFSSKAKKVSLIGEFNDWTEQPLKKVAKNRWEISIEIPEGTYLYNFVVDGKIVLDPHNKKPPRLSKRGHKSSVLELK